LGSRSLAIDKKPLWPAAGLVLRPYWEALNRGSSRDRQEAVTKLGNFALLGRVPAKDLLERILKDRSQFSTDVRFLAANALIRFGTWQEDDRVLWRAVEEFQAIESAEWTRERDELQWAKLQESLGDAFQSIGKLETYVDRLKKAERAFRWAREVYAAKGMQREMDGANKRCDETQRILDQRQNKPEQVAQAA
jgi:hypothetical protein